MKTSDTGFDHEFEIFFKEFFFAKKENDAFNISIFDGTNKLKEINISFNELLMAVEGQIDRDFNFCKEFNSYIVIKTE